MATLALLAVGCVPDAAERRASIYDLTAHPTEENVRKIRDLLGDPDAQIRATALNALVGLAVPDAGPLALRSLSDENGFVRATAAKLLADVGDPAHVDALAACLLEDPDPTARQRAAQALARLGGPAAVQALAVGLEDPMDKVRIASVEGMRVLDPGYAKDALARLLREDTMWEIRAQAARVLGLTGDPEVLPELEAALGDPNEYVRSAAANAIRLNRALRQGSLDERPATSAPPSPSGV